jgi:hypothetical protein
MPVVFVLLLLLLLLFACLFVCFVVVVVVVVVVAVVVFVLLLLLLLLLLLPVLLFLSLSFVLLFVSRPGGSLSLAFGQRVSPCLMAVDRHSATATYTQSRNVFGLSDPVALTIAHRTDQASRRLYLHFTLVNASPLPMAHVACRYDWVMQLLFNSGLNQIFVFF